MIERLQKILSARGVASRRTAERMILDGRVQVNGRIATLGQTVEPDEDEILVGEIVNVSADESILTDGVIDMRKLKPIAYDPVGHTYVAMGATVGHAFSDGKKLG